MAFLPVFQGARPPFLCRPVFGNKQQNAFFCLVLCHFASKSCKNVQKTQKRNILTAPKSWSKYKKDTASKFFSTLCLVINKKVKCI